MKILYHCYGQAHSSVTAANIHLGHLPRHRRATLVEIAHQPCFDRTEDHEVGRPRLMGTDEWGHQVYVVGLAGGKRAMEQAVQDFLIHSGVPASDFLFANALQHAGVPLRIGGYTSRRLGVIWLGRPLSAIGVWLKYRQFVALVEEVFRQVKPVGQPMCLDHPFFFQDNDLDRVT